MGNYLFNCECIIFPETVTHYSRMKQMFKRHDVEYMVETVQKRQVLPIKYLKRLCESAKEVLRKERNVVEISAPVKICGDIHGQFPDLLQLLRLGGDPSVTKYLFLGDYVDRGYYGVQVIQLLLALKVKYPTTFFLLRGNHESRTTTKDYGFYDECLHKYSDVQAYNALMEVFDYLPIAAVVENKFLCMHGGLPENISHVEDITKINRFQEIPFEGQFTDLLWSDPSQKPGFSPNHERGAGKYFGPDATKKFIYQNGLRCITRAHEVVMEGFNLTHEERVMTIFSAPNYCYRCGNKGAFLQLGPDLNGRIVVFSQVGHQSRDKGTETKKVPSHFS